MIDIEKTLEAWRRDLMVSIPVAGLLSRNPVAYKWKAPFRCWMLREAVAWRLMDLMTQAKALQNLGHTLGARILVRSAFETLATLIYLNQMMERVLKGELNFQAFGDETSVLLLGSRTNPDGLVSRNIATVLQKCEKSYPGLSMLYADLSESAHPSYEGLARGYSKINHDDYETHFSNRWSELYGDRFQDHAGICLETFQYEYSNVWPERMERLEAWIEINDEALEAEKLRSGG